MQSMYSLANPSERNRVDRWLKDTQVSLGEETFAALWTAGLQSRLDQVVADALRGRGESTPLEKPPAEIGLADNPLTPREREVVRLLVRGTPAAKIAETLVISQGAVRSHIEHVLTKLQLHSRIQLAAWAVQRGFLEPDIDIGSP